MSRPRFRNDGDHPAQSSVLAIFRWIPSPEAWPDRQTLDLSRMPGGIFVPNLTYGHTHGIGVT